MLTARITPKQPFYAIQDALSGLCFSQRADKPAWRDRTFSTWFPTHQAAEACMVARQVVGCIEIVRFDA
jgi:hypothetical protein